MKYVETHQNMHISMQTHTHTHTHTQAHTSTHKHIHTHKESKLEREERREESVCACGLFLTLKKLPISRAVEAEDLALAYLTRSNS